MTSNDFLPISGIFRQTGDAASTGAASSVVLRLRPHHLLCLQTFAGYGYSQGFVSHMAAVQQRLRQDPAAAIVLVRGTDELCLHCPNCVQDHCSSDKPALFDRLVSDKLDSACLHGIPSCLHVTKQLLSECCPSCEWKELCLEQTAQLSLLQ